MDYLRIWYIKHETQCFKAFKTPLKQYEVFQKTSRFSDPYSNKKNVLSSIWCWLSRKNIWWKEKNLGIQRQVVYNRYINTPRCMNFYTFGSQLSGSWEWYFSTSVMSAEAFSNHQRGRIKRIQCKEWIYSVIPRLNAGRRLNAGLEKTPGQNCRFLNWQTRTKNF